MVRCNTLELVVGKETRGLWLLRIELRAPVSDGAVGQLEIE